MNNSMNKAFAVLLFGPLLLIVVPIFVSAVLLRYLAISIRYVSDMVLKYCESFFNKVSESI